MFRILQLFRKRQSWVLSLFFPESVILTMFPYTAAFNKPPTRGNVSTSQVRQGSQVISTDSCLKDTAKGWQRVPVPSVGVGRRISTHFKLSAATAREDWRRMKVGRGLRREGLTQEAWGNILLSVLREVVPHFHNQFYSICMRWLSIFQFILFSCMPSLKFFWRKFSVKG